MGPGSLYTSIIPNLLVRSWLEAIAASKVPRIYVCNIMTEPGETEGFTVSDQYPGHLIRPVDRYLF